MFYSDSPVRNASRVKAVKQNGPDLYQYGSLIREITKCPDVCILSLDLSGKLRLATDVVGSWGALADDPALPLYNAAAKLKDAVIVEDTSRDPGLIEEYLDDPQYGFWALVPVKSPSGEARGLVIARSREPGPLTTRSRKLLTITAQQIGAHMEYKLQRRIQDPLRLIAALDELREYDSDIASHTLYGFMRMTAKQKPRAVERTALLISGLAEERDGVFGLNADGNRLSLLYGLDLLNYIPDTDDDANPDAEPVLFARLRVGDREYEIGSVENDERLYVRISDKQAWVQLWHRMGEGWNRVAAEVVSIAQDVTHDYIRMHMMHLTEGTASTEHAFDLYGIRWSVRGEGSEIEVKFESDDWKSVNLTEDIAGKDLRSRAAMGLMIAVPQIVRRVSNSVEEWTNRIALGAIVTPAFS